MVNDVTKTPKLHNSGRKAFRRCRLRWHLGTRLGWRKQEESENLWTGSAFHRGLQAYHSTNPPDKTAVVPAIDGYFKERVRQWGYTPPDLDLVRSMLLGMFRHYNREWLKDREPLETLFLDGAPLVEVPFAIDLGPGNPPFEGEFDRVVKHNGLVWVVEYKTAKTFNTEKLSKDEQTTTYIWAAEKVLGHLGDIGGVIYQQHRKAVPVPPEPLKRGGLTRNKTKLANVPEYMYLQAIKKNRLDPADYFDILEHLRLAWTEHGDQFIRRDFVTRTPEELESFEENLRLELPEYTNPALPIYPNPTNDCAWDCDFAVVCDVIQNKGNAEDVLAALFTKEKPSA